MTTTVASAVATDEAAPEARRPSICFLAQNAYGMLTGKETGHFGGIERLASIMSRWFASQGYPTSIVTYDEGHDDEQVVDGVRLLKMCRRDQGVPYLRTLHPRWTSLIGALRRADSEVYVYCCGDMGLGQLAMWCRGNGRKSVFSIVSEPDCNATLPALRPLRERVLYRRGLRLVDRILVQTRRQQEMLFSGFRRESTVVPVPCRGCPEEQYSPPQLPRGQPPRVLWVGRFSAEKRLEWLLDIADRCRGVAFDVVGDANIRTEYAASLLRRAQAMKNVRLHGRRPPDLMGEHYRAASLLCCTSVYEGFPNVFLEAWSYGVPVVTTFDPDELVARRNLGSVEHSVEGLAAAVRHILTEEPAWRRQCEAARRYYLDNHTVDKAMGRFAAALQELPS